MTHTPITSRVQRLSAVFIGLTVVFASLHFRIHPRELPAQATQEATDLTTATAERIRTAFTEGLPVAGSWSTGASTSINGFNPVWQMKQIQQGKVILPWFQLPNPDTDTEQDWEKIKAYYEEPLKFAAEHRLPIALKAMQWEAALVSRTYREKPLAENPTAQNPDGTFSTKLSPLGAVEPWYEIGSLYMSHPNIKKLQELYPDPPFVLFYFNNEPPLYPWDKLAFGEKRYQDLYGTEENYEQMAKVAQEGWAERYTKLHQGIRDALVSDVWRANIKIIGYTGFGDRYAIGIDDNSRFAARDLAAHRFMSVDYPPAAWDGASYRANTDDWSTVRDDIVRSPQVEAGNVVFFLRKTREQFKKFFAEVSFWDGGDGKVKQYEKDGQTYSPARYQGMVQFVMWAQRPQSVREFRESTATLEKYEKLFHVIANAVTDVHTNNILRHFWRNGTLVENPSGGHPYRANIPAEHKAESRWFVLDADVNQPTDSWYTDRSYLSKVNVFALAHVIGDAPNREWLLYAHAPIKQHDNVTITIPGYNAVIVPIVKRNGSFYHVREVDNTVTEITITEAPDTVIYRTPGTPRDVEVLEATPSAISISWTDPSNIETGFSIERRVASEKTFTTIGTVGANVTAFTDTSVVEGTRYHYQVRTINVDVYSTPTRFVGITAGSSTRTTAAASTTAASVTESSATAASSSDATTTASSSSASASATADSSSSDSSTENALSSANESDQSSEEEEAASADEENTGTAISEDLLLNNRAPTMHLRDTFFRVKPGEGHVEFTVGVNDPNRNLKLFSIRNPETFPGATFWGEETSKQFYWTPEPNTRGEYDIIFYAIDTLGEKDEKSVTVILDSPADSQESFEEAEDEQFILPVPSSGLSDAEEEQRSAVQSASLSFASGCPILHGTSLSDTNGTLNLRMGNTSLTFADIPTSEWFARFIAAIVHVGLASGYQDSAGNSLGFFGPEREVTYGELAKIAIRFADVPLSRGSARNPTAKGDWSEAFVKTAEDRGMLAFQSRPNVNEPATRGAVVQTLLEAARIDIEGGKKSIFRDVAAWFHPYANAVLTATDLGIIEGTRGIFRLNDPINRAELSKILGTLIGMRCE